MKSNTRPLLFWAGIVLLILPGLLHAYLLMPFPGSQDINAITVCYYLEKIILPMRILGAALLLLYLFIYFVKNTRNQKIIKATVLIVCLGSFYFTDYMFKAEVMFKETQKARFANGLKNKVPQSYSIIGVVNNGVAKAYPIIYLGYHHKVQDSIGGKPVLVTYCTMCRTGRVYDPVIDGKEQTFRLVGARHYNAIIEDEHTGSWWYQATGDAAVGPQKGKKLAEMPYEQMTLGAWLTKYPATQIMQPDKIYMDDYIDLKDYDHKQSVDKDSTLKNKDSLVKKSWMIGIISNGKPKAYDWRHLVKKRVLNDDFNGTPLVIAIEEDFQSFHTWSSMVDGKALHFIMDAEKCLRDKETSSLWDWTGTCIDGAHKGKKLGNIQGYQEYWRSWKQFHPETEFWKGV